MSPSLAGLELLATAIVAVGQNVAVRYMNPAAENLFKVSSRNAEGCALDALFPGNAVLHAAIEHARADKATYTEHDLEFVMEDAKLRLSCTVTPIDFADGAHDPGFLLEFRHIEQQLKIAREERILDQTQANRELIRNLAHEIKNPLGGIRGAAQLLDHELERPTLHEYTQVIMKEADRLRSLLDRLLTPNRPPHISEVNVHEVLERVRSLILAEFPEGIAVVREYDTSLPVLIGDKEQLIQAVLNIARNAAQAMQGKGRLILMTRVARQVTIAKKRFKLAISMQIIDNGPGIPDSIKDRIFDPLVSGREGGQGVGLTLAQTFVSQHQGMIECTSIPGRTAFNILLPMTES